MVVTKIDGNLTALGRSILGILDAGRITANDRYVAVGGIFRMVTDGLAAGLGQGHAVFDNRPAHLIVLVEIDIGALRRDAIGPLTDVDRTTILKDAVVARIKGFVDPAQVVEFPVAETFAKGPIVMNERTDRFVRPDRTNTFHVVGVFFVRDGKIAEWTDYIIRG